MADIGTTNISFSSLKAAYVAGGKTDGDGNSGLRDGEIDTAISISSFRNASLSDGSSIPSGTNEISINSHFKDKTFGSKIITTDQFRAYTVWSAHQTSLKGESGTSTYTGPTTANKRVLLSIFGQSSSFPYPILLLSPTSTSPYNPGIIVDRSDSNVVDEATVWFRVVSHNPAMMVQLGIVAKDMTTDNWEDQLDDLGNKHGTYCDRLSFHGKGYHNYAGSRDDILSSSAIVTPAYTQNSGSNGTYGSNLTTYFHTRTGKSAGTQRSNNAASAPGLGTNGYFFKTSLTNYNAYRGDTVYANHGLKIKWYETTLQCSLVENSNVIQPVSPPSTWSSGDLTDVFAGMYIYGTGINSSDGAFIAEVNTNYMVMYKQKGSSTTSLVESLAESDQTTVTLTISGYLYWTLVTTPDTLNSNSNYESGNVQILGPPHQVLPKYQASTSSSTPAVEIKEWAYYIGDTTSGTKNYLYYDLRNQEPGGNALSYSVSYGSGTVPTVTNKIEIKYHRYGSSFNSSWTPQGSLTIEGGTFVLYFWNTNDNSLTKLGTRLNDQQHTSTTAAYTTITYDINQPEGTTGYLLFIEYGWNNYLADMGIGEVIHQYDDNTTKQTLYSPSSNYTTARNSQTWMKTQRQDVSIGSYLTGTNASDLEDEIAFKSRSLSSSSWSNLTSGTSWTGGWQQDNNGTGSSGTGPSRGSDGLSNSYYIYCETSGRSGTSIIAYAALRVPITVRGIHTDGV
jgi:hypothetical protein